MDEETIRRINEATGVNTLARLEAMEAVLHTLIATHPDPKHLAQSWAQGAPATMDRLMETIPRSRLLESAVAEQLQYWGRTLDGIARSKPPSS